MLRMKSGPRGLDDCASHTGTVTAEGRCGTTPSAARKPSAAHKPRDRFAGLVLFVKPEGGNKMKFHTRLAVTLAFCSAAVTLADALSRTGEVLELIEQSGRPASSRVPATGEVEYAFSPRQGAERLVLKVIATANNELRVLGYSFTSVPVAAALVAARKRGVDVRVVVDHRSNTSEDRSGKARPALSALALAGIHVRTISVHAVHHDKVIVADRLTTQTGSFNFSAAAANANSENVLVLWNNPDVARGYLRHWEHNWRQGTDWKPAF
jgi:phosphatidylserine/phosphatidylglycerophosphate/cardiolipin synthase-like enzyme